MGKKEIELRIKFNETLLDRYIALSQQPFVDKERVTAMIEKTRVLLASLYMEREYSNS